MHVLVLSLSLLINLFSLQNLYSARYNDDPITPIQAMLQASASDRIVHTKMSEPQNALNHYSIGRYRYRLDHFARSIKATFHFIFSEETFHFAIDHNIVLPQATFTEEEAHNLKNSLANAKKLLNSWGKERAEQLAELQEAHHLLDHIKEFMKKKEKETLQADLEQDEERGIPDIDSLEQKRDEALPTVDDDLEKSPTTPEYKVIPSNILSSFLDENAKKRIEFTKLSMLATGEKFIEQQWRENERIETGLRLRVLRVTTFGKARAANLFWETDYPEILPPKKDRKVRFSDQPATSSAPPTLSPCSRS